MENKEPNRYAKILEAIFAKHFKKGMSEIEFERTEISQAAKELGIALPKNLGDVLYSFRYRTSLPKSITANAPKGHEWIIRPAGKGKYKLAAVKQANIAPSNILAETKILDATPGVIAKYSLSDEQSLLAKLRYNRLIDIFTGLTCYSLQSHLRTTLSDGSQVETDEIYIGLDKRGAHFVLPIQAKGGNDRIGVVQIEQDFEMCTLKFSHLTCRPIAAQFMDKNLIALFEFEQSKDGVRVSSEKHYRLVKPNELSSEELQGYSGRQN
ncbi:MAG: endonuclease [Anaerolineales bacterium]|nr:endonuclease [Anaerolineales bacterium]